PDTGLVEIVGDVFAPLDRDRRTAVEIVIKRTGIQIFLRSDAVHIKMGKGHRPAVDIDNAEGWAADRVGTTQPLGNAAAESSHARTQSAGKDNQTAAAQLFGQLAAQRGGLLLGM